MYLKYVNKRLFFSCAMGCWFALLVGCAPPTPEITPKTPNIILIMADDLGFDDLGIRNKDLHTPHLDALYRQSVSFEQFYVNPVCAPSRASFLTGRDFIRTGVSHVHGGKDFIHLGETLLPEALKENGYATGMWGKWHSGHSTGYFPWERGFDEAYMADLYKHRESSGLWNGQAVQHEKWADEVLVDYALDFIARHKERPFFAFLPSLSPHSPVRAPERLIEQYQQRGFSKNLAALYAMITFMDEQIGRLLAYLEAEGLAENTVVIFLSDNGPQISSGFLTPEERQQRYVSGLKGHKGNIWENGVKSPLFVRWPAQLRAGERAQLADITDVYPTLVALAGGQYPSAQKPLDGQSLLPVLRQEPSTQEKYHFNWAHFGWAPSDAKPYHLDGAPGEYAPFQQDTLQGEVQIMSIRNQRYKLLLNAQKTDEMPTAPAKWALFDILTDPGETTNLFAEQPEVANALQATLMARFEDARTDAHAFQMPVFVLDRATPPSRVWAKAPVEQTEGLYNSALELTHWTAESRASYALFVRRKGYYIPFVQLTSASCAAPWVRLHTKQQVYTFAAEAGTQPMPVYFDSGYQQLDIQLYNPETATCDTLAAAVKFLSFTYQDE